MEVAAASSSSAKMVKREENESVFHEIHDAVFDQLPDVIDRIGQVAYLLPGADDDVAENKEAAQFIGFWNSKEPIPFTGFRNGHLPVDRAYARFAEYTGEYEKPPSDIQQAAIGMQLYNSLSIPTHNDGSLQLFPFRAHIDVQGMVQLCPSAMYTQAERNVDESPNTINIVGAMDASGNLSIRSGVYNTANKAHQIMAVVRQMYELRQKQLDIPFGKVRLLIQQLNSPGIWKIGEGRLIDGQSQQSHLIEQLIDPWLGYVEAPQVAYFNTSCNQFNALPGQSSHKKNLVGAAALVEWMCQDLFSKSPPDFLEQGKGHGRMRVTLQRILKARDEQNVAEAKKQNGILKKRLSKVGQKLIGLSGELGAADSADARMQAVAARIIGHVALQQTDSTDKVDGIRKLVVMEEIGTHFLAGRLVNATIMKNCWSGVDRTGFAAGLEYAIDRMLERELKQNGGDRAAAFETAYDFLLTFEQRVLEMDAKTRELDSAGYQAWLEGEGEEFSAEIQFQHQMWEYLMAVSQTVEWNSSGVWGLKWETKGFINKHPLPYLPRFVFDDATENWISLIDPASSDRFTEQGRNIFLGHAKHRNG